MAKRKSAREFSWLNHQHSVQGWTVGQRVSLAITLEASARKLGNVHPEASFADMRYEDFLRSALAIAPCFDQRNKLSVGKLVYDAVAATQAAVKVNTNLGTVLLLAPVAIAARDYWKSSTSPSRFSDALAQLRERTALIIDRLSAQDSQAVYAAIRLAAPGGLGKTDKLDVHHIDAPTNLVEAMRVVEEIDQVARTYCTRFHFLFDEVVPALNQAIEQCGDTSQGIRLFQLRWLAEHGDSLVHRKLGASENLLLRKKASGLLQIFENEEQQMTARFEKKWQLLDRWMREDGHRKNPGTTADLIAAGLFVLLCCER